MGFSAGVLFLVAATLPGVVALFAFYANINTAEIKVSPPPLNSTFALTIIGIGATLAHAVYAGLLALASAYPCKLSVPLADPYHLLFAQSESLDRTDFGLAMVGLIWLVAIGFVLGRIFALGTWKARDELLFGWILPTIQKARPATHFINAYVIIDAQHGKDILGYEGAVLNLTLDSQKNITGLILRDVETFYVRMNQNGTKRISGGSDIAVIALTSEDFKNVALDVFEDPFYEPVSE